ncbi:MAG TPA: hypothetical protein PLV68_14260 [Ilumatobacteraceae bacterium]|nr:hypothetical protein [Ilumatobacteraceae bacterium]
MLRRAGRALSAPVAVGRSAPLVDEWGRAQSLIDVVMPLLFARWDVSVGGSEHLPRHGGALIVANARRFAHTSIYAALSIGDTVGRPVRFAGRSDMAPLGALARRIGGLLEHPDEVSGALRAGELVLITTAATGSSAHAGTVDPAMMRAAARAGVAVHPAATESSPTSREARVEIAAPVVTERPRRGPLAEADMADAVQRRLQELLDEMGDARPGVPVLDWLRGS